jgi:uncharacterized protein YndB with AHSA1/START domain
MGAPDDLSLRASVTVRVPAPVAFRVFTEQLDSWWVREFTWSGPDCLERIGIEPGTGGKAYEIGPHGLRLDWGRVLVWEPPGRIVLSWQIAPDRVPQPDPTRASEVEVHFHDSRPGHDGPRATVVDLEHRLFQRHGPDGVGYRGAMTYGWRELLDRFAEAADAAAA